MTKDHSHQIIVVGGGVIGLCIALEARRRGLDVTLLRREQGDGEDTCSNGNAGMVVPSHFVPLAAPGMIAKGIRWMLNPESPFAVRMAPDPRLLRWAWLFNLHCNQKHVEAQRELLRDLNLESRARFGEMAAEMGFPFEPRGLLMVCHTPEGLARESAVAAEAEKLGLEVRILNRECLQALNPNVTLDGAGAVHYLQDAALDPGAFVAALLSHAHAAGVNIESGVEVTDARRSGNHIQSLVAGGRHFAADEFVIAGGVWTARLLARMGIDLPMQPGKGYSLTLDNPPEMPSVCSILSEAHIAVTPMGGSLRVAGTMEVGSWDMKVRDGRVRGILRGLHRFFPKLEPGLFKGVTPWAGLRPVSPDGLPYIGRWPGTDNLTLATGHAMMGLSLAPVTGQLVGEILEGKEPRPGAKALDPARFSRRR